MKGTGTQTDPFIIMTADDLYSMEELGGEGIYCRLGADIELNGTPYAENFVPIPVNWSSLDGNDHKIRNIFVSDPTNYVHAFRVMTAGTIRISGLMLENVVLCGTVVNLFTADSGITADIKLYDCALVLKVSHLTGSVISGENCILHGSGLTVSSELSVVALSAVMNRGYTLFNGGTIRRTQIVIDVTVHDAGASSIPETSIFRNVNVSDSWITGSVYCDVSGTGHIYNMADYYCSFSNFYQAVAMKGIDYVYWNNTFSSVCFYDTDLMAGAVYDSRETISRLFYGLTTEQCKDPDYLASIGFICAG